MHNFFAARKHLVKQCTVIFSAVPGDLKRKNSRTVAPFWPERDLIVVGSRVDASGQRSIERNLTPQFFCGRESFMSMSNVFLQVKKKREILEYCCSRERGTSWSRKLSSLRPRITIFFFNDTATTEIYTLSLHDALPI